MVRSYGIPWFALVIDRTIVGGVEIVEFKIFAFEFEDE